MSSVETERLIVRQPAEADRSRFIELFTDETFTVFSPGVHSLDSADARFNQMVILAAAVPYAKQPVVEKSSGLVVGYTGVGTIMFEGLNRLEWGWRFVSEARGKGYATEATTALLAVADDHSDGDVLCLIDSTNVASRRVADKVGFRLWRHIDWPDLPPVPTDLLLRSVGAGGRPLVAPLSTHRGL